MLQDIVLPSRTTVSTSAVAARVVVFERARVSPLVHSLLYVDTLPVYGWGNLLNVHMAQ